MQHHGKHIIKEEYHSYNDESSNNNQDQEHRGRGRPKGSKNKKTIQKETSQVREAPIV